VSDAAKWARARAITACQEEMQEAYREHKRLQNLESRFRGAADAPKMYETGTNEKGEPPSQFEFEVLCERWCVVFGELPPFGPPDETPQTDPEPLPPDDAMLAVREMVRITVLSKSTIKRWVNDPASTFPKPVKLSPRRIGWRADRVKAWRRHIESIGSCRKH
jgi:predicted DNA-binding transcriptional regulator AlpA